MAEQATIFDRMSRIARQQQIVMVLKQAAQRSRMHPGEQLRFEAMIDQLAGIAPRKNPLPMPRGDTNGR